MTKASIQAVAREAGVSVSTVSRTFAKPDLVLPETRDRVMTAAEKLDYSVSRSATTLCPTPCATPPSAMTSLRICPCDAMRMR